MPLVYVFCKCIYHFPFLFQSQFNHKLYYKLTLIDTCIVIIKTSSNIHAFMNSENMRFHVRTHVNKNTVRYNVYKDKFTHTKPSTKLIHQQNFEISSLCLCWPRSLFFASLSLSPLSSPSACPCRWLVSCLNDVCLRVFCWWSVLLYVVRCVLYLLHCFFPSFFSSLRFFFRLVHFTTLHHTKEKEEREEERGKEGEKQGERAGEKMREEEKEVKIMWETGLPNHELLICYFALPLFPSNMYRSNPQA